MAVPKWSPDDDVWETFEPSGRTEVDTRDMSPEQVVSSDGESTLVHVVRMGIHGAKTGTLDGDLFLAEAIPARFLTFMRDKDPSGLIRRHIAQYLRKVADEWESGGVLTHVPHVPDDASRKNNP